MPTLEKLLASYLLHRPLFLALIRAKEAYLFQRQLPLKKPVLDLGCGDGFFAQVTFGHLTIGLDVSDSRINEVKDTYRQVVVYDGHKVPCKNNSISTVVSNCVLEHIPNLAEVTQEVYRVLRPRGKFIVSVMAKPWEDNLFGSLLLGNSYKSWMRHKQVHFNLLTSSEWRKHFAKNKFNILSQTGYLTPSTCRLLDICHYLSLPSLATYVLFQNWNIFKRNFYPTKLLSAIIQANCAVEKAGAIFFVLQK